MASEGSKTGNRVVVGLGQTGQACIRYLMEQTASTVRAVDTREHPPNIEGLLARYPDLPVQLGCDDCDWVLEAGELVVSPGVPLTLPMIAKARAAGVPVVGDIELFCCAADRPVIAVTGSNGKSTVTALLGEMALQAGVRVAVGGNIGIPALDLLGQEVDYYLLELSSFQLETTHSLQAYAATILNLSEDHMDRYSSMSEYASAKHRIYNNCHHVVCNRSDDMTWPRYRQNSSITFFSAAAPGGNDFGLQRDGHKIWLASGNEQLLAVDEMAMPGLHNQMNALAALALGKTMGLSVESMCQTLREFGGLSHRCQKVAVIDGVTWINDSKATNVGASVASIEGVGSGLSGKVVLIAGGDGKGGSFEDLRETVERYVREIILIGRDAGEIDSAVGDRVTSVRVDSLDAAVERACSASRPGDAVLLAPACASFDMFENYQQRGELFASAVRRRVK